MRAIRSSGASGLRLTVATPRWQDRVSLQLPGRFNVHNALAAIGVGEALDLDPAAMRAGLEAAGPGARTDGDASTLGQPFRVIVDYAHTPDSLAKVLDDLAPSRRPAAAGLSRLRLGGRPGYGQAADDGPRRRRAMHAWSSSPTRTRASEDRSASSRTSPPAPSGAGAPRADLLLIADRRTAIAPPSSEARAGDVVVLCGKGHERSIEMADGPIPWDDPSVAREKARPDGLRRSRGGGGCGRRGRWQGSRRGRRQGVAGIGQCDRGKLVGEWIGIDPAQVEVDHDGQVFAG